MVLMVKNKRGQFFELFLVLITVFMIGIVIGFYYLQNIQYENTASSLVSAKEVMEVEDDLEIFEMKEIEIIKESLEKSSGGFGSGEFINSFRSNYFQEVVQDEFMINFLVEDLFFDGKIVETDAREQFNDFLSNSLYPRDLSKFENGKFIFERAEVGKRKLLVAKENNKINFPVDFVYSFKSKYLISFENGEYKVERLEEK